jgi:RNA polymerase sigma factor (sigma-70 family)
VSDEVDVLAWLGLRIDGGRLYSNVQLRNLRRFVIKTGLSAEDAEDVVSDCFLALARTVKQGKPIPENRLGYLFGTAKNIALALVNRRRREQPLDDTARGPLAGQSDAPDAALIKETLAQLENRLVKRALRELSPADAETLQAILRGVSIEEAAAAAGVSYAAMKQRFYRARLAFSELVRDSRDGRAYVELKKLDRE